MTRNDLFLWLLAVTAAGLFGFFLVFASSEKERLSECAIAECPSGMTPKSLDGLCVCLVLPKGVSR